LKSSGIELRKPGGKARVTFLPILDIVNEYEEGATLNDLGEKYKVSHTPLRRALSDSGVTMRSRGSPRIHFVNDDFFETIDTEQKACWLGFLGADGGLCSSRPIINLGLERKDKHHVIKFKEVLDATYPIRDREQVNKKWEYLS